MLRRTLPALLLASTAGVLGAQQVERGAFVVMLGADTIAVERYVRTAGRLEGEMVLRAPATVHRSWVAELGAGEAVTRFTYRARRVAGGGPPTHAELTFGAADVVMRVRAGERDTTLHIASAGALPYVNLSYGLMEQLLRRASRIAGDSAVLPLVYVGRAAPVSAVVKRVGPDSATLAAFEPHASRMRVDAAHRILGLRGDATTQKVVVTRLDDVDVAAQAASWARSDAAGAAMGALSPLDSVTGTLAGAQATVVYSRPSLRGRALLGHLVPHGTPWRTGANAATLLRTSRDLIVGGTRVPAGRYSLWTIVTPAGAELVVNRQVGQWGTEYDAAHDLARIPLTVSRGDTVRERFTFGVEEGRMWYGWGDVVFSVGVTPAG